MNRIRDIYLNVAGAFIGTVGTVSDLNSVQIISAVSALFMATVALVRACISVVEVVRKYKDRKITAEEADARLKDITADFDEKGERK